MLPFIRTLRKQGVASPYGPPVVASLVFLAAWLFPPNAYSGYMREPDLVFLDTVSILFFFSCVVAFLCGLRVSRLMKPASWTRPRPNYNVTSPIIYICIPIILATVFCGIALGIFGSKVNYLSLLLSQQGQMLKQYNGEKASIQGVWVNAPAYLCGVLWWSLYRRLQLPEIRKIGTPLKILWWAACFLEIATLIAHVDRTAMVPLLLGCGLIYLYWKHAVTPMRLLALARYGGRWLGLVVGLFVLVSFFRGNFAARLLTNNFLGYTIAPYNRFAGVLHGQLRYFYAGRGAYLFPYLQDVYVGNSGAAIQTTFGWPSQLELYNSEYSSVALAGLDRRYLWSGAFGFLYADIGWGALIYVFCAGMLAGILWCKLRASSSIGIVLYPWVASWVFLWGTWNLLFNNFFVHLLPVAIGLTFWDRMFLRVTAREPEEMTMPVPAPFGLVGN